MVKRDPCATEVKLARCPFCKCDDGIMYNASRGGFHVWCAGISPHDGILCDAQGPNRETPDLAARAWNTGAAQAEEEASDAV